MVILGMVYDCFNHMMFKGASNWANTRVSQADSGHLELTVPDGNALVRRHELEAMACLHTLSLVCFRMITIAVHSA